MYYLCHLRFHIASLKHTARGGVTLRGEVCDLFGQIGRVDGFHHYVVRACPCQVGEHRRCHCLGYNEECGRGIAAVAEHLAAPYQLCTVKSGQPCIDDGNVGVDSSDLAESVLSVTRFCDNGISECAEAFAAAAAELLVRIGYKYACFLFHYVSIPFFGALTHRLRQSCIFGRCSTESRKLQSPYFCYYGNILP